MKKSVLFTIIFIIWLFAGSFIYVCMVRKDCQKAQTVQTMDKPATEPGDSLSTASQSPDTGIEPDTANVADTQKTASENDTARIDALIAKLNNEKIYFEFGKSTADITESLSEDIQQLAEYYNQNKLKFTVELTGYSDNVGSDEANIKISQKRADFVKSEFVKRGIPASVITTKAMGKANPIAPNDTEEGRKQNRRVEIKITKTN